MIKFILLIIYNLIRLRNTVYKLRLRINVSVLISKSSVFVRFSVYVRSVFMFMQPCTMLGKNLGTKFLYIYTYNYNGSIGR